MSTDPTCPFCSTPLSEHPANRCLDAWAECVRLNIEPSRCERFFDCVTPHLMYRNPDGQEQCVIWLGRSTDIAAAMELVDDQRDFILCKNVIALGEGEPLTLWKASFVAWPDGPGEPSATAGTPAHAITKAFIAAKQRGYRRPQP